MSSPEITSTTENANTDPTYRERAAEALRRRALGKTAIVMAEEVDSLIDSIRILGFSLATITKKSSKLID